MALPTVIGSQSNRLLLMLEQDTMTEATANCHQYASSGTHDIPPRTGTEEFALAQTHIPALCTTCDVLGLSSLAMMTELRSVTVNTQKGRWRMARLQNIAVQIRLTPGVHQSPLLYKSKSGVVSPPNIGNILNLNINTDIGLIKMFLLSSKHRPKSNNKNDEWKKICLPPPLCVKIYELNFLCYLCSSADVL